MSLRAEVKLALGASGPSLAAASDLSWMTTFIISIGWITQVAIMPDSPPIQNGCTASANFVQLLFSTGADVSYYRVLIIKLKISYKFSTLVSFPKEAANVHS